MKPILVSVMMVIANLAVIILAMQVYPLPTGGVFVAIVAAVAAGAVVQRLRFGRRTDKTARFDPIVTAGSIAAFDAVLVVALLARP